MAESIREEILTNGLSNSENVLNFDCAVCLQTCVHPAELPCGHIFCYLCIKGIVNQGRRCAMCRQDIPLDYLDKPRLLKPMDAETTSQGFEDGHLWFYEGHNGWWQYDERTSIELECAYQKRERCCDLLIAGFLYVADFDGMLQYRKSDPSRRRRIKRDLATTSKKGIAGLKATNLTSSNSSQVVTNETIQNLPVSRSSALNNLNDLRIFRTRSLQHSDQQINRSTTTNEPVEQAQNLQNSSSPSTHRTTDPPNLLETSTLNNSGLHTRNINLDNAIHDTLDWTIEQIESLNLELLNDYETLVRDVNNYRQQGDNLNQSRQQRQSNIYIRYLNGGNRSVLECVTNPTDRAIDLSLSSNNLTNSLSVLEYVSNLTDRPLDLSLSSNNLTNSSSEVPPVTLPETSTTNSETRETQTQSQPDSPPPPLPPRMNRARRRRDSPQHSLSLS